jgi:hypothetical protein
MLSKSLPRNISSPAIGLSCCEQQDHQYLVRGAGRSKTQTTCHSSGRHERRVPSLENANCPLD